MRPFTIGELRSVVVVGAHPDDIEIGAGGLLLALPAGVQVRYLVLTGSPVRHEEARAAAATFLGHADVTFRAESLPDGRLPEHAGTVKDVLESVAGPVPDLVLTPSATDLHQDHRLLGTMAPTVWRDSVHLQYEIPKWDGDLTRRSVYVPMSDEVARRKVALLNEVYPSQHGRDWWDDEMFLGLARLRGMECRARYAEAFTCDKLVLGL
ncbi:PIG-L deacetylase family protein [Kineosporia succinea]|uniref:LmbE family N-acetylglucosaminyl deacetylase n=1 Tax=Kineosporia succinea TaxID=84632 RepID=A0ABT9PAQ9_9ACTN|nr:PIG-L family deacetylase [Kineosporia succinea]MDP9829774.1 LmbE family N-acetylglucosaminyl deacetylase [Kineosporia succinea]